MTLTGPSSLAAGATGSFTLKVAGGPGSVAGFNASLGGANSGQAVITPGSDQKLSAGELVHAVPTSFAGGSASFVFTVKAPLTAGTFTIYASGLSANNNSTNKDDNSASTTLAVTVGGTTTAPAADAGTATPVPDAGSVVVAPKPDAGSTPSSGGGTSGGSTIKNTNKQVAETDTRRGLAEGEFGCSSSSTAPMVLLAAAVLLVLASRRRQTAVKVRN